MSCGASGDTQFDHTWIEGIRACEGFTTELSVSSAPQVILRHVEVVGYPPNTAKTRNDTQRQENISRAGIMSYAGITDSDNCAELAKSTLYICALLSFCTYNRC